MNQLNGVDLHRTERLVPGFLEDWTDGIDPAVWTHLDPATNPNVVQVAGGKWEYYISMVANETARLYFNRGYSVTPTLWDEKNSIFKYLEFEWEIKVTNSSNLDATQVLMGLSPAINATRGANDVMGFNINGTNFYSLTDRAGTESIQNIGGTLTNWNKLKMACSPNRVDFLINEVLVRGHSAVASIPDQVAYPYFFFDTTAGGACQIEIGNIRMTYRDYIPGVDYDRG